MAKTNYPEEQVEEWRRLLQNDLQTLFRLVVRQDEPLDEGSVRACTPILRRWLIEGLLHKLCRGLEAKAKLPALNNEQVLSSLMAAPEVSYFLTGGVKFNGSTVAGVYVSDKPYSGRPPIPINTMHFEMMRVKDFIQQKRLYYRGEFFSCGEIIKFVANKLGGVHHDDTRDPRQVLMAQAAEAVTFGGPTEYPMSRKFGQTHLVVEPKAIEPLNGLHVEVIAAAASLLCVEFNGQPLLQFEVKRDLRSRISDFLGIRNRAFIRSVGVIERQSV